jgi:hypothetical protein
MKKKLKQRLHFRYDQLLCNVLISFGLKYTQLFCRWNIGWYVYMSLHQPVFLFWKFNFMQKWEMHFNDVMVLIDSITKFCLSLLVCTNGLSYLGEETQPTLCIKVTPNQPGVGDHKRNKEQLWHRIQSVRTFTNLQ